MLSDKTLYILAVGVLAVGVGHGYSTQLNQSSEWAQCALSEVQQVADRVSTRVASYADALSGRYVDRLDVVDARMQAAIDRAQARVDRVQATVERGNAEIVRVNVAMDKVNARVVCLRAKGLPR